MMNSRVLILKMAFHWLLLISRKLPQERNRISTIHSPLESSSQQMQLLPFHYGRTGLLMILSTVKSSHFPHLSALSFCLWYSSEQHASIWKISGQLTKKVKNTKWCFTNPWRILHWLVWWISRKVWSSFQPRWRQMKVSLRKYWSLVPFDFMRRTGNFWTMW